MSKTVSDKLRAHLLSQGVDGIPASNTAVFNVLQDHGIVQPTPDGKAIWKATVTSDAGWSHAVHLPEGIAGDDLGCRRPAGAVRRPVLVEEEQAGPTPQAPAVADGPRGRHRSCPGEHGADRIRRHRHRRGCAARSAGRHRSIHSTGDPGLSCLRVRSRRLRPDPAEDEPRAFRGSHGAFRAHFMAWLRQGIQTRKLIINDAKALVHTVAGTAYLVSPGVFQRYAQEFLQVAALAKQEKLEGWQWIQKRFEKLGQHRKQPSGLNIWTCEVTGPRKSRRLHGYLLTSADALFCERRRIIPYLRLIDEAARRDNAVLGGNDDDDQDRHAVGARAAFNPRMGPTPPAWLRSASSVGGTAFQRTGDLEDERERGDMLAALDLAHVRPFDAGHVGQRFLSDTLVGSFLPHGSPKRDGWFRFVGSGAGGRPFGSNALHCQSVDRGHDLNHVKLNSHSGFGSQLAAILPLGELDVESSDITAEIRMAVLGEWVPPQLASVLVLQRAEEPETMSSRRMDRSRSRRGAARRRLRLRLVCGCPAVAWLVCEPLWHDTLAVAMAKRSHLLAYREVPCREVLKQSVICSQSTTDEPWRMTVQRVFDDALHEREQTVETFDVAMTLVGAGYGIAIAPAARLASYLRRGVAVRPLAGAPTIVMAYLLRRNASFVGHPGKIRPPRAIGVLTGARGSRFRHDPASCC